MQFTSAAVRASARMFIAVAVVCTTSAALAVDPNYIETFSTDAGGWAGDSNPTLITNGGPGGLGDQYLNITSSASVGNGNLATFNTGPVWTGRYNGNVALGEPLILGVRADLANFGSTPLDIRVIFLNTSANIVSTVEVAQVPADGVWRRYEWGFSPVSGLGLTSVLGSQTIPETMSNVTQLMFRHNVTPASGGDAVTGSLGLDNIELVPFIPAPSTASLLALAGFAAARRRR